MPTAPAVRVTSAALYLLPIRTRMPLKFGPETLTEVTCARVRLTVEDGSGRTATGWGETPLSVQWAWPSPAAYEPRLQAMIALGRKLTSAWCDSDLGRGHPIELGHWFLEERLSDVMREVDRERSDEAGPMPVLAGLICASPFDLALHDAYGVLVDRFVYETYNRTFMSSDLSFFLESDPDGTSFAGRYPHEFLRAKPLTSLPAWHLVGGRDPLGPEDLTGEEPYDGEPVLLRDWIRRDGLTSLKIKLTGTDPAWDSNRLLQVGRIAEQEGVEALSADFNCTVRDPETVNEVLDRLERDEPKTFERILYVEQPFPYDLEAHRLDVGSVAERKPLFMDESAHDWRYVRMGRSLGWTGVALKTCKTQTGALLSHCWAKAHGMGLMVQDLTNPMLAQIPHLLLGAWVETIRGVETNGMQFYPRASDPEAAVHPGLYRRRGGRVELSTLSGPGFGYRLAEIERALPEPEVLAEA